MFNDLQGLGTGIIVFAIIIGVGTIILYNFGGATASCPMNQAWNSSNDLCQTPGNVSNTTTPTSTSWTNTGYLTTQLGSSGGLASWTPAIIAVSVGLLFLGAFLGKGRNKSRH